MAARKLIFRQFLYGTKTYVDISLLSVTSENDFHIFNKMVKGQKTRKYQNQQIFTTKLAKEKKIICKKTRGCETVGGSETSLISGDCHQPLVPVAMVMVPIVLSKRENPPFFRVDSKY